VGVKEDWSHQAWEVEAAGLLLRASGAAEVVEEEEAAAVEGLALCLEDRMYKCVVSYEVVKLEGYNASHNPRMLALQQPRSAPNEQLGSKRRHSISDCSFWLPAMVLLLTLRMCSVQGGGLRQRQSSPAAKLRHDQATSTRASRPLDQGTWHSANVSHDSY
jgi:hypothetical protein